MKIKKTILKIFWLLKNKLGVYKIIEFKFFNFEMTLVEDDIIDQIYFYIPKPFYHKITFYLLELIILIIFVLFGSISVLYSLIWFTIFNIVGFILINNLIPFFIQIKMLFFFQKSDVYLY